jgi:TonB family protein
LVIILQGSRITMLLSGTVRETTLGGPRPLSLGLSVLVHGCVLSLLAGQRPIVIPKSKSAYELMVQGREHKLVWYHFKEKLPEVRPTKSKADNRPLRAEVRTPRQSIVSAPKNAPKAPQMIWQKAPEIKTDIKLDSPNLVAVSLPKVEPPKEFVPPVPQQKKLYTPQIDLPTPPEVQANATRPPVESALARPVRDFKPPTPSRRKTDLPKIDAAAPPELQTGGAPKPVQLAGVGALPEVSRPLRDFKLPPSRPKAGPPQISYVDPSAALAASAGGPRNPVVGQVPEASLGKVYRPFEAPPTPQNAGGRVKAGAAVPVLPSAPPVDAAGNSGELNAVVVGLNPGTQLPALPPVSRPADFSAGPKLNPNGGAGEGNSNALSVPDLTIRSGNIDTRSTIMARNTMPKPVGRPDPNETLREAAKYITVDEIGHPSATRVASAPDTRFDGRAVYMMAIQMPNITSYIGSWLMWYSERSAQPVSTAVITPPVVHRKVDPKYIAAAVSERVEGTVRLTAVIRKDGTVGSVELSRGLDERLDRTAQQALSKWQFAPAMRNGESIDVEILVEIPFRLAPRAER